MTSEQSWEKEFDKKFIFMGEFSVCSPLKKSFIKDLLASERQSFGERVIATLEEKDSFIWNRINHSPDCDYIKIRGNCTCLLTTDDCLSEAITIIKSLL